MRFKKSSLFGSKKKSTFGGPAPPPQIDPGYGPATKQRPKAVFCNMGLGNYQQSNVDFLRKCNKSTLFGYGTQHKKNMTICGLYTER